MAHGQAYAHLVKNADVLLESNIYWTERLLLRQVRALCTRLRERVLILPLDKVEELSRE